MAPDLRPPILQPHLGSDGSAYKHPDEVDEMLASAAQRAHYQVGDARNRAIADWQVPV